MAGVIQDWSYWKCWNASTNDDTAVIGMRFLKELCEAYQDELSKAKDQYESRKKAVYNEHRDRLNAINNAETRETGEIRQKGNAAAAQIETDERCSVDTYHTDLQKYMSCNGPATGIRKIIEKLTASWFTAMEASALSAHQKEASTFEQAHLAFETQKREQKALVDAQIKRAAAKAEFERSKELDWYTEAQDKLQIEFKQTTDELERKFRMILNEVMSNKAINEYVKMVGSSNPSAENFTCAATIPEYICLGDVSMEIAKKASTLPEVTRMISEEASNALTANTPGALTAALPYCQRLDDGISLFVNYTERERKNYQEMLRMLILKLYMAFPAGKLEATMIDPLELGETFSLFTKLGEEQSRIIDTKIWSQEKDITECINVLRQKLETMTQAYGEDKETRLEKEPVRVLAITDFPTGFTQNALRDLQAIVRKAASCGVCVLIWANTEEMAKLQASQQSVFNEIKNMLHAASVKDNALILDTAKYPDVKLALDPMADAKANSTEIINTLVKGIHGSQKRIVRFADMYNGIEDPNNWFGGDTIDEFAIPIGIKGANTVVKLAMGRMGGSTAHHTLIAGQTGAGKSTLLHTIIMGTLLNFSPDEVQLYLVDFKEGVEFKTYSKLNLPSVRVVAIDCEREFGLNILRELEKEMQRRYTTFKREADREDISEYRKTRGVKIPKLLVIFDEVQELFRGAEDDAINKECEHLLGELLTLGRASGIHIVLASQNFDLIPSIKQTLFAHSAIRIALNGSEDSVQSVLGPGNAGAKQLKKDGTFVAIYNDNSGADYANVVFQVAYLEKEERADYLKKLSALQNSEAFARKYKGTTRVLLTNAEDDVFNVFNQFIFSKKITPLDEDTSNYCLTIGDGFELRRRFKFGLTPRSKENLMVIGSNEKRAASIFYYSILSLLYAEQCDKGKRKDNQLINLIDLSVEDEYAEQDNTSFRHLERCFPKQIKRRTMRDMAEMISATHDTLLRRMDGLDQSGERLFLMFFGVNRAHKLLSMSVNGENMYNDNYGDEAKLDIRAKLAEIMRHGPEHGINCIFWGENLPATTSIIGNNIDRDFAQRIAFATDNATYELLVREMGGQLLRPTTAVYMNVEDDVKNTHFRPYEIPARVWVEKFAKTIANHRGFE